MSYAPGITIGGALADHMPAPAILAAGPDPNLWFTGTYGSIDRVGVMVEFPLPDAAGEAGHLGFTAACRSQIDRIMPACVAAEFSVKRVRR